MVIRALALFLTLTLCRLETLAPQRQAQLAGQFLFTEQTLAPVALHIKGRAWTPAAHSAVMDIEGRAALPLAMHLESFYGEVFAALILYGGLTNDFFRNIKFPMKLLTDIVEQMRNAKILKKVTTPQNFVFELLDGNKATYKYIALLVGDKLGSQTQVLARFLAGYVAAWVETDEIIEHILDSLRISWDRPEDKILPIDRDVVTLKVFHDDPAMLEGLVRAFVLHSIAGYLAATHRQLYKMQSSDILQGNWMKAPSFRNDPLWNKMALILLKGSKPLERILVAHIMGLGDKWVHPKITSEAKRDLFLPHRNHNLNAKLGEILLMRAA